MYFLKALDFRRPASLILESDQPLSSAAVTAPMWKLWPLYLELSNRQKSRHSWRIISKYDLATGWPVAKQNNGPGNLGLSCRKFTRHLIAGSEECVYSLVNLTTLAPSLILRLNFLKPTTASLISPWTDVTLTSLSCNICSWGISLTATSSQILAKVENAKRNIALNLPYTCTVRNRNFKWLVLPALATFYSTLVL